MKKDNIRILFIGPHRPNRNPSQRFRMEQYFPYLVSHGFTCDYSWFISEKQDAVLYSQGNHVGKFLLFVNAVRVRLLDVIKAGHYDIIFVQREAFMTGSVFFERMFAQTKAKLVFDFDDAIWLNDTSAANKKLSWIKRPSKTGDIIKLADRVIAGNQFLAAYAKSFNSRVTVIPTVVDTQIFTPATFPNLTGTPVCIGWTGSFSTLKHFQLLLPVLQSLKERHGNNITIRVISDINSMPRESWIDRVPWNAESEVTDLQQIDIGVMPLPNDEWSKGKCGFKAIQYMSLAIPCVVSPVGVNNEIVKHNSNGFFAGNDDEWMEYLSMLITSVELRKQLGMQARKTIEQDYSLHSQLPVFLSLLQQVVEK